MRQNNGQTQIYPTVLTVCGGFATKCRTCPSSYVGSDKKFLLLIGLTLGLGSLRNAAPALRKCEKQGKMAAKQPFLQLETTNFYLNV